MRQAQALGVLLAGGPVFMTGAPGAGKSYVLNRFVRLAEAAGRRVAVTASTGIAATHIGGTTIHSWSGLGVRETLSRRELDALAARDKLVKRFNGTDTLVIDEVSMLHGRFLNMLNDVSRRLREDDAPFGRLQVVLVGDMFQLPPVNRGGAAVDFAHESEAWRELDPKVCYITEQHRQTGDGLLGLLEAMRLGTANDDHRQLLLDRIRQKPDATLNITRLFAHNADVDAINQRHLAALDSDVKTYYMATTGAAAKVEQLARGVLAPEVLELKAGAEVMFVANDFTKGFANGTRGRVVSTGGTWPQVELANGKIIVVEPHTWQMMEDGRVRAEVSQLPLRLAWAITIHKSQGMSLDAAEIDLSRSFTPGMGYVALSRVRSLEGLFLRGVNRMALQLHPDIFELDQQLRNASAKLADEVEDYIEEELPAPPAKAAASSTPLNIDEALFEKLKTWRTARARQDGMPPYIIAHNKLLEEIAARPPQSERELLAIKGMGKAKLAAIGPDILAIVRAHTAQP